MATGYISASVKPHAAPRAVSEPCAASLTDEVLHAGAHARGTTPARSRRGCACEQSPLLEDLRLRLWRNR